MSVILTKQNWPGTAIRLVLFFCATCVVVLWIRSYRPIPDQVTWLYHADRYCLRSERGKLVLRAPPGRRSMLRPEAAEAWVRTIFNDQIDWRVNVTLNKEGPLIHFPIALVDHIGRPLSRINELNAAVLLRPLLQAMEEPNRFAAAHVVLNFKSSYRWSMGKRDQASMTQQQPAAIVANDDGLMVQIHLKSGSLTDIDPVHSNSNANPKRIWELDRNSGVVALIDSAQMSALRRRWHDRLDEPVVALPHALFLVILLGPLALSLRSPIRQYLRGRQGRCRACGYDLRETPARCPECGS